MYIISFSEYSNSCLLDDWVIQNNTQPLQPMRKCHLSFIGGSHTTIFQIAAPGLAPKSHPHYLKKIDARSPTASQVSKLQKRTRVVYKSSADIKGHVWSVGPSPVRLPCSASLITMRRLVWIAAAVPSPLSLFIENPPILSPAPGLLRLPRFSWIPCHLGVWRPSPR